MRSNKIPKNFIAAQRSLFRRGAWGNAFGGPKAVPPTLQQFNSFEKSGMRVVDGAVEGMGGEVAEIFFVEFDKALNEGGTAAEGLFGEGVCLVFVFSRNPI